MAEKARTRYIVQWLGILVGLTAILSACQAPHQMGATFTPESHDTPYAHIFYLPLIYHTPPPQPAPDWIWGGPSDVTVYFRKTFEAPDAIVSATLQVGGTVSRTVYMNGVLVADEDIRYAFLPTVVNITPFVQAGSNTVAVLAGRQDDPGVSVQISIELIGGRKLIIPTDSAWRASSKAPPNWMDPNWDDRHWPTAQLVRRWGDDSSRMAWEIHQAVWDLQGGSASGPAAPHSPDLLAQYQWNALSADDSWQRVYVRPTAILSVENPASFSNLDSLLTPIPDVTVISSGTLVLDFGRELGGWVELSSPDLSASLCISVSENTDPAASLGGTVSRGYQRGEQRVYRLPVANHEGLYAGVRYAWIKVGPTERPWHITDLYASWQVKPANYIGRFACSDPDLTRTWYAGAYTTRLNFERDWINTILRPRGDRYPWGGDNRIAEATSLVAFGNYDFVKKDIHYWDDKINSSPPRSFNTIPGYTLHWILGLVNYFRYTGDTAEMESRVGGLLSLLDEFDAYFDNPDQAGLNFIDFGGWGTNLSQVPSRPNVKRAYQLMYIQTLREVAWAMEQIERRDLARRYNDRADTRSAQWRQANPEWVTNPERHVVTNAILAGLPTEAEQKQLSEIGLGHSGQHLTVTPFFTSFILEALARANRRADALEAIRTMWGGMNQMDATTHWEIYYVDWPAQFAPSMPWVHPTMSFCHPWSSGATSWLSSYVLGIRPTAPGFSRYDILPYLGDLSWIEGAMPTPHGAISATFRVSTNTLTVTLDLPPHTLGRIGAPVGDRDIQRVNVNNTPAWGATGYLPFPGIGNLYTDTTFLYFSDVQPGCYTITVYSSANPSPPPQPVRTNVVVDDEDDAIEWQDPARKLTLSHDAWAPSSYGIGFHIAEPGQGETQATFHLTLPAAGLYRVYAMWPQLPEAATNAPITIHYHGGTQTMTVDQHIDRDNPWNYMGAYPFEQNGGSITISNLADGPVVIDAFRLEHVSEDL